MMLIILVVISEAESKDRSENVPKSQDTATEIEVRGGPHEVFQPREGGWPGSGVSVLLSCHVVVKIPQIFPNGQGLA